MNTPTTRKLARLTAFSYLLTGFLLLPSLFAAERPLPPGGVSLLTGDTIASFKLMANPAIVAPAEVVPVEGQPFRQALRLRTLAKTATPWDAQLYAATAAPVHAGDVLFARFYLRGAESKAETGSGSTELVIEQGAPDYKKLVLIGGNAGPEWQEISIRFTATANKIGAPEIPAGKASVFFRLGYGPQTIEIGGVEILNFGNRARLEDLPESHITYPGREPGAAWRKDAEERIEKIRKAGLTIRVRDSAGRPVPGAVVSVNMQRHAFGFGSAVAADMILARTPDGEKYRETILGYFNKVVMENDLKWGGWEENRQRAIDGVKWLRDHGIAVRGHNLVWPGWHNLPKDLQSLKNNPAGLAKRINNHITDEVTAMKGQCVEWDVINEPYNNHDLQDILGRESMVSWFQLAHQADPSAKLYINDYDTVESGRRNNAHTDAYEETIRYLLEKGAPLSGIGIQSHFNSNLPAPAAVLKGFDRFAKLGPELEITEHDIDVADGQLQADYTRDYMTLAFSHPAVTGFLSWGFWEGRHWKPEGAYFRKDWSIKPAGKVWIDLVTNKWWTRAKGETDASGSYGTRGFLGDYEITVTRNGKSKTLRATLTKESFPVEVVVE
jgi:GH35 family endo-1,4-beta-xylanase